MSFPTAISSCRTGLRPAHALALARLGMASLMLACQAGAESRAADGSAAAPRPRIVDPAIQQAGGISCTSCGPGGCRPLHGGQHHGHHAGCRDGVCVPYCPVRPQEFGFYGTQWRRWPGQAIVPVSAERDVAPVSPPRSAVPGAGEESLSPQGESEAGTGSDSAPTPLAPTRQPLPEPVRPQPTPEPGRLEPAPESRPEPKADSRTKPEPQREPSREPPMESAAPQAEPPARPAGETKPNATEPAKQAPETKPRPEDENLFEVLSGWRARRTFPVGVAGGSTAATAAARQEGPRRVGHAEEPTPRDVPRVPFDPAAETRRLRSAR
jgi:hypothetical protein